MIIAQEILTLAKRLYQGNLPSAFRHWAMLCLVADQDLSEEDLLNHIELDGSGDLGIDGYYIDEGNETLILMQAKYSSQSSTPVSRGMATDLRAAALALKDQDYVKRNGNLRMRDAAPEIFEILMDDSYTLRLILSTNRKVAPGAKNYASGPGSALWAFEAEGQEHRKNVVMEILNPEDLVQYKSELQAGVTGTPEVSLSLQSSAFHEIQGEFRAAQAAVLAKDVAEAYRVHRQAIFRQNVRGPLGSNKVNKDIADTLKDALKKKNFHILNNGLTALCDSFIYDREGARLTISNFQVVNGCQTAFTLYTHREELDETVWVKMTLVEGQTWAPLIARSTNTQNTVKAEDFRTLDEVQQHFKRKFDSLEPPWLYELKRGEGRFLTPAQRRLNSSKYGNRKLAMREVSQDTLSFLGKPAMAKWDLRVLFDPQNEEGKRLYNRIFNDRVVAEQLLLPTKIARWVEDKVKTLHRDALQREQAGDSSAEADWLPYARMHFVALIAEWLRLSANDQELPEGLLSQSSSRARIATLEPNDGWIEQAFNAALDAIKYRIEVTLGIIREASGSFPGWRDYFRNAENYRKMVERLKERSH